jgi:hypothetical protein
MPLATAPTELQCPFGEKEEAKALGARWDAAQRFWFVPPGLELEAFTRWLPGQRHYLTVPFEEKEEAKALGAMWDVEKRRWYTRPGTDLAPFARWDAPATPGRPGPSTPPRRPPGGADGAGSSSSSTPATSAQKRTREEGAGDRAPTCPVHRVHLLGPHTVRNGLEHNRGRQFYVCPNKDGECGMRGGWVWADGTAPFSAASCRRVEAYHGLEADAVGVGVPVGGGLQIVGDEMKDGELVNPRLQRGGQEAGPK